MTILLTLMLLLLLKYLKKLLLSLFMKKKLLKIVSQHTKKKSPFMKLHLNLITMLLPLLKKVLS